MAQFGTPPIGRRNRMEVAMENDDQVAEFQESYFRRLDPKASEPL
jgi:hypothetical protein